MLKSCRGILTLLLLVASAIVPADATAQDDVVKVGAISVEGLRTFEEEELLYILGLSPGTDVPMEHVTLGIKRAFSKGIFNSLAVEQDGDGIRIIVEEYETVGGIDLKPGPLKRKDLLSALSLKKGDYIAPDIIEKRRMQMELYVKGRGFPDANAQIILMRNGLDGPVRLALDIDYGQPLLVEEMVLDGIEEQDGIKVMQLNPGNRYDEQVIKADLERLRKYYLNDGYLNPLVGPATLSGGTLSIQVLRGKRIIYHIKGNEIFPDKTLEALMPFSSQGEVTDELVSEGAERVIEFYKEEGYSGVQVAPVISEGPGAITIKLYVSEGKVTTVRSLNIIKDGTVTRDGVRKVINNRQGARYLPSKLADDRRIIEDFYVALGYRDVRVTEPGIEIDRLSSKIEFEVVTGKKYFISEVSLEGAERYPAAVIKMSIKVKPGIPYNAQDISDSRRNAQTACRSLGYKDCVVDVRTEFIPDGVSVFFDVNIGEKYLFGTTVVSGNRKVSTLTIMRHLKYSDGQLFNATKLAETRQRLLSLGLFSSVRVSILDVHDNMADILVKVSESRPGTLDFGFGYGEYEGFRAFVEIGHRNLFGDANTGSVRLEASTLWRRYLISYLEPYLIGTDIRSRTFLLREESKHKNIDTGDISYRVIKNSATTGVEKDMGRRVTISLYYDYSIVETYDVQPDVILSKEDTGTMAISSLSPAIYYKTLNNTFDPTRGVLIGLVVKDASQSLLSETEFTKYTLQANGYSRLMRRVVGALSLRGGVATVRGDTTAMPVVERFFLGGRNTVRGFEQDSLGPVGATGLPIGGSYFLLGNLEFRIRVTGAWRTVLFGDCGNVWLNKDEVSTGDLRCSSGLGLRYNTPVGPLRLDYGRKIDQEPSETSGELHFSIGHAF